MKALYDGQSEYVCLTRYYHWRGMRAKTLAHCRPHLKYYVPSFVCMRMRLSFFQYIFYCSFIYLAFFNIYIYICVCVCYVVQHPENDHRWLMQIRYDSIKSGRMVSTT